MILIQDTVECCVMFLAVSPPCPMAFHRSFIAGRGFLCAKTRCKTNVGGLQSLLKDRGREEEEGLVGGLEHCFFPHILGHPN